MKRIFFENLCAIRERTADGKPVGRCCFPVKDGRCPRHGDVLAVQERYRSAGELTDEREHARR